MSLFKLQDHLKSLLIEEAHLFEDGDWEGLNLIRMAIDDTHDQIAKFNNKKTPVQWKYDAPLNPFFLGAQPARIGEDY
jgi:hypothetical protein